MDNSDKGGEAAKPLVRGVPAWLTVRKTAVTDRVLPTIGRREAIEIRARLFAKTTDVVDLREPAAGQPFGDDSTGLGSGCSP